jgi:hypothetical protein
MSQKKTIDYLLEDRPLHGQKYALVSVVGPNYKQNCDIYAIKIRGFANDLEEAKRLTQSIMKYDPSFDIYTAPVGIFFPIDVDPTKVKNVQYANKALNDLVQNYHENQIEAQDNFHLRKQEMMKKAIKEGKDQETAFKQPEHPVSVLGRVQEYKTRIREMNENIKSLQLELDTTESKWNQYQDVDKQEAQNILSKNIQTEIDEKNKNNDNDSDDDDFGEQIDFATLDYTQQNNVTQIAVQKFKESSKALGEPRSSLDVQSTVQSTVKSTHDILLKLDDIQTELSKIDENKNTMTPLQQQRHNTLSLEKESLVGLLNTPDKTDASSFLNKSFGHTENTAIMEHL